MSTLRINNIEAQSIPASPTIDEKVKVTNSSGDILVNIDGKTSGITTIGINTTDGNIKFDANSNVLITGILTATTLSGNFTPTSLEIGSNIKLGNAGVITATSFVGSGANLTGIAGGVTSDAQRNTIGGSNSGDSFDGTNATDNTLLGYDSGTAITTGDKNTLIGSYAGDSVTTSANITAIGYYAASTVSTQSVWTGITAVGSGACKTSVGVRNTVVGFDALKNGSSAAYNCILGNEAAISSDGTGNVVIGDTAHKYGTSSASHNIVLGRNAFVGHNANHASSNSISIGYHSMYNSNRTTSYGNIAIGSSAGQILTTGNNNIIIGDSAEATSATTNNEITLGNANTTKFRIPGLNFINDSGKVGVNTNSPTLNGNEQGIHIVSGDYPTLHLTNQATGHGASNGSMFTLNNTGETIIRNGHNSHIRFDTNGSNERFRIGSSGQFGIGGANYGSSGQVLTSQGASSAVQWATPAAGGKILQVKQSVKTNTQSFSTGSSTLADSYFDITGLSVSLTPASGTKILVSYSVNVGGQSGYGQALVLFRDSTQIYMGDADGNRPRVSNFNFTLNNEDVETFSGMFLDTHGANGSTAVTYKLQMYVATPGWTSRVNRGQTSGNSRYYGRGASNITVMEVAA